MPEAPDFHQPFDSSDLSALPTLPAVVGDLLAAFADDNASIQALARIISRDAPLSARMLAVANSAAYRSRSPRVSSLERTLTVVGLATAKTIAVTTAIYQTFSHLHGIPPNELAPFWRHILVCAHLVRRLAAITAYPAPDEAYLCGLLHDIGRLLIAVRHPNAFEAVRARAPTLCDVPVLERELFGADHCTLGAALVESWRLHSFLADAIRFHHQPVDKLCDAHPLLRLLQTANALSQANEPDDAAFADADRLLGLTPALLRRARAEAEFEVAALVVDLGIASPEASAGQDAAAPPVMPHWRQRVQEQALIDGVRGEMCAADGEPALLEAIARCAAILFNLAEVRFFLLNPATGLLHSHDPDGPLREGVDLAGAENALVRALRERRLSHTLGEDSAGLLDRQLCRLWQADGVLCLPLYAAADPLGAMAVGIARTQAPRLLAQSPMLELFASEAAIQLGQLRRREARCRRIEEDRRLLERQQLRAVLHEVANPLTIVRNYLHLLTIRLGVQAPMEELRILREETERVGRILLRLTEPDHDQAHAAAGVNLNGVVRDLSRVLDDALCRPRGIRLSLDLAPDIPPLKAGGDPIRQVLLNLVRNAVEAMEAGGTITVTTRDQVHWHGRFYVELAVADTGPGIAAEQQAGLFQPIASAKGDGHAGLGLTIIKKLIDELGGYVSYRPNQGGGALFLILLPRPG